MQSDHRPRVGRSLNELLEDYLSGDLEAFVEYAQRVIPLLHDTLSPLLAGSGRTDWLEDISQEVMRRALTRLKKLQANGEQVTLTEGWYHTVAKNVLRDRFRQERRKATLVYLEGDCEDRQQAQDGERKLWREQCEALLARLSPQDAVLLRMLYLEDLSVTEVANALHCKPAAIYKREQRALVRLRTIFPSTQDAAVQFLGK